MEEIQTNITHLPEALFTEILARLPLRSISTCKSVCKTWKSTLESTYFRRVFVSRHNKSSPSWSLMTLRGSDEVVGTTELVGFHGCLQKSIASFIPPSLKQHLPCLDIGNFSHRLSSNGLVLIGQRFCNDGCFVGNPVLQQWVQIPPPICLDPSSLLGFVTRVDDDGVVLSFKIVRLAELRVSTMSVYLYSSDTGIWTSKLIHCPYRITEPEFSITLNGTMYFFKSPFQSGVFLSYDFYDESEQYCFYPEIEQFRVVHYPDHLIDVNSGFTRTLTSSRGFVMYIRTLAQEEEFFFKVWRLNNDDSWQFLWNLSLPIIGKCVPMAMHPFDSGIVYLWSPKNCQLVSCNLHTRNHRILRDGDDFQDCVIDERACDDHLSYYGASITALLQFVFPPWMESMPCPPEVEMIDTTSLLSEITSMTIKSNRGRRILASFTDRC